MSLELLDVSAMDTGRYHAMVVQDAEDRRAIKGFFHIAYAAPLRNLNKGRDELEFEARRGIQRLADFMNTHTAVRTDVGRGVSFDSEELFFTPWVYFRITHTFDPTEGEMDNIGRYMLHGGFLWGDCWGETPIYASGRRSIIRFIVDALGGQGYNRGKDWDFERLPESHPIMRCYFDFDAPPVVWSLDAKYYRQDEGWDTTPSLEGVVIDGLLICILTNQSYARAWAGWGPDGIYKLEARLAGFDPTRAFQFGVNTLVFALTREGSITRRVMDSVR